MGHSISIRDVTPADETNWRQLWSAYCLFYEATLPEAATASTWRRMLDPASAIHGRIAEVDGRTAGFAVHVLHEATWTLNVACYLEDLFVDPELRGMGIGRALLDDLVQLGRAHGWSILYWNTKADNATARHLYDNFCVADGFVRYRMLLG